MANEEISLDSLGPKVDALEAIHQADFPHVSESDWEKYTRYLKNMMLGQSNRLMGNRVEVAAFFSQNRLPFFGEITPDSELGRYITERKQAFMDQSRGVTSNRSRSPLNQVERTYLRDLPAELRAREIHEILHPDATPERSTIKEQSYDRVLESSPIPPDQGELRIANQAIVDNVLKNGLLDNRDVTNSDAGQQAADGVKAVSRPRRVDFVAIPALPRGQIPQIPGGDFFRPLSDTELASGDTLGIILKELIDPAFGNSLLDIVAERQGEMQEDRLNLPDSSLSDRWHHSFVVITKLQDLDRVTELAPRNMLEFPAQSPVVPEVFYAVLCPECMQDYLEKAKERFGLDNLELIVVPSVDCEVVTYRITNGKKDEVNTNVVIPDYKSAARVLLSKGGNLAFHIVRCNTQDDLEGDLVDAQKGI